MHDFFINMRPVQSGMAFDEDSLHVGYTLLIIMCLSLKQWDPDPSQLLGFN